MSLFSRLAARLGYVRQGWAEHLAWMLAGGMATRSGVALSNEKALQVAAVLACVRVIAEGIGALPVALRQRTAEGAEDNTSADAAWLLQEPNAWMTWQEVAETLTMHAALTGNGFALIQRGVRGQPIGVLPLLPSWVQWKQTADWSIEYRVTWPGGRQQLVGLIDMFHLRGPSWDSVAGLEVVRLARESIGLAAAIEWTQAGHFGKGGTPSGVLTLEGRVSQEQAEDLQTRWQRAYTGEGAGKIAVLGNGAKFQPYELNFASQQTLETRRQQVEEICRAFRVFPQMVGFGDKATTYASAEAFFVAHAVHTLGPWARRWELTLGRDLLAPRQRATGLFFHVNTEAILRADTKATGEFLRQMVDGGIMSRNEARRRLGLNAVPGGDTPTPAANIGGSATRPAEPAPAAP
ncbi:phage portal protein [Paracraurococcus ruber]|uniref:Phage portal protein n=1 Tax=Paracraurococcus ruber TaxID=77675 RepID=A0ABS1CS80_9PROT|nr:phage portal protein [Paracraurococcus ruber]MBK1656852.1 phage portal protein [Paracraurococcus ruber]TDG33967.1 phage portal protein [Paracraurococcus ruber]